MIEIAERPANDVIRKRNKKRLADGLNASALITDQEMVIYEGVQIGWLNNHPKGKPGVALMVAVDEETREEIDREVQRHLGESVPIGQAPEPDDDEPEEEEPECIIILPEGYDDES